MNNIQKTKLTKFVNENKDLIRSKNYTKIYDILQTIDNNENSLDNQIIYCFTEMMFKIGENPFKEMEEIYYQAGKGLSIVELTIPNSVKAIGDEAFMDCTKLKTVKMSDSVTEIGDMAFKNCSKLTLCSSLNSSGNIKIPICPYLVISLVVFKKTTSPYNFTKK